MTEHSWEMTRIWAAAVSGVIIALLARICWLLDDIREHLKGKK